MVKSLFRVTGVLQWRHTGLILNFKASFCIWGCCLHFCTMCVLGTCKAWKVSNPLGLEFQAVVICQVNIEVLDIGVTFKSTVLGFALRRNYSSGCLRALVHVWAVYVTYFLHMDKLLLVSEGFRQVLASPLYVYICCWVLTYMGEGSVLK